MSLRPVDWQLSMWNLEQRAQEAPKDPLSAALAASRQVESQRRQEDQRRRLAEAEASSADRPLEGAAEREAGSGGGGRRGNKRGGGPKEGPGDPEGGASGSFEVYG